MGKSLRRKPVAAGRGRPSQRGWVFVKAPLFWIALAMALLFAMFIRQQFALNDELIREEKATADLERRSPDTAWDSSWPLLPSAGQPATTLEEVRALYAFASRRSDVLQYIPCYCGCDRDGHRSNVDCYVRGRTTGGVPQWDAHAYT